MNNLIVGTIKFATVIREIETGYVLDIDDFEVLLHYNDMKENEAYSEEDELEVFLYNDKNEQVVATTIIPHVDRDTFGWAKVINVIPKLGAFVDIGTTKEILVSVDDLPIYTEVWPQENDFLYVSLGEDRRGRLLAIPAKEYEIEPIFKPAENVELNSHIKGTVYYTNREGAAFLTEDNIRGFIHQSERYEEPRLGESVEGRVIEVKDDGTINASLLPLKEERIDSDSDVILAYLENNDGTMPYNDKSNPDEIRDVFGMSKSAFKRALGKLMRERLINQNESGTFIVK